MTQNLQTSRGDEYTGPDPVIVKGFKRGVAAYCVYAVLWSLAVVRKDSVEVVNGMFPGIVLTDDWAIAGSMTTGHMWRLLLFAILFPLCGGAFAAARESWLATAPARETTVRRRYTPFARLFSNGFLGCVLGAVAGAVSLIPHGGGEAPISALLAGMLVMPAAGCVVALVVTGYRMYHESQAAGTYGVRTARDFSEVVKSMAIMACEQPLATWRDVFVSMSVEDMKDTIAALRWYSGTIPENVQTIMQYELRIKQMDHAPAIRHTRPDLPLAANPDEMPSPAAVMAAGPEGRAWVQEMMQNSVGPQSPVQAADPGPSWAIPGLRHRFRRGAAGVPDYAVDPVYARGHVIVAGGETMGLQSLRQRVMTAIRNEAYHRAVALVRSFQSEIVSVHPEGTTPTAGYSGFTFEAEGAGGREAADRELIEAIHSANPALRRASASDTTDAVMDELADLLERTTFTSPEATPGRVAEVRQQMTGAGVVLDAAMSDIATQIANMEPEEAARALRMAIQIRQPPGVQAAPFVPWTTVPVGDAVGDTRPEQLANFHPHNEEVAFFAEAVNAVNDPLDAAMVCVNRTGQPITLAMLNTFIRRRRADATQAMCDAAMQEIATPRSRDAQLYWLDWLQTGTLPSFTTMPQGERERTAAFLDTALGVPHTPADPPVPPEATSQYVAPRNRGMEIE